MSEPVERVRTELVGESPNVIRMSGRELVGQTELDVLGDSQAVTALPLGIGGCGSRCDAKVCVFRFLA